MTGKRILVSSYLACAALAVSPVLSGCGEPDGTSPEPSTAETASSDLQAGNTQPALDSPAKSAGQNTKPLAATGKSAGKMAGMGSMSFPPPEEMVFKDDVTSNITPPTGLNGLVFVDTDGNRVALTSYLGKKNVVLVFTEGFAGMLCPFCKTQTSRLVANYKKFQALETEVLVVYPGTRDHLEEFIEAAKTVDKKQVDDVPFPIVLDPEMDAVDFFSIRSKLAHPSTYVIDKQGNVRLAYVGGDMSADRPSLKAIFKTIKAAGE